MPAPSPSLTRTAAVTVQASTIWSVVDFEGIARRETTVRQLARSVLDSGVVVTTIHIDPGTYGYLRMDGCQFETAVARGDDLTVSARYQTQEEALVWHNLYATWLVPAGLDDTSQE